MPAPAALLLIHLLATWFLVGLIWTIQLVHYAQFELVGETNWLHYHRRHSTGITFLVAPMMLIELATGVGLLFARPAAVPGCVAWIGLALIAALWLSTAVIQVPLHNRLAKAFDASACRSLATGNWVRTFVWSVRGGLIAYAMMRVLGF